MSFTNLRDTPDEYTLDDNGSFIKIKVEQNDSGESVGNLQL